MRLKEELMTPEARRRYYERLRSMSGIRKVQVMSALHAQARRIVRASIRNQNPDLTDEQVELEARRRFLTWNK